MSKEAESELIDALEATVMAFRLGMDAEAGESFARFIDALGPAMAAPGAGPRAEELVPHFPEILAAQRRGDGLAVADALEYQLAPVLRAPQVSGPSK